jgi:hypothetical protein
MRSIKFLAIDIITTTLIIVAVFWNNRWLNYFLLIYSIFMIIFNLVSVIKLKLARQKPVGKIIPNVHYLLYIFNAAVLWSYGWRLYAALWATIWFLSLLIEWRLHLPKFKNLFGSY